MEKKKVVIIGGVAAGASCAARLRRLDEFAEIIVLEKSGFISYANCGLPYYVGKEITDFENLILQTPESLYRRFRIDVRLNSEAVKVDFEDKTVEVKDKDGTYVQDYDVLVLCPGCHPRKTFSSDFELPSLRNVEDVVRLENAVYDHENIAVIGGGFIGVELAENLVNRGKKVTLFEYAKQVLTNLDKDMVSYVEDELKRNGVNLLTSSKITGVTKEGSNYSIALEDGSSYLFDFVVAAAGVEPSTSFLKDTILKLDAQGYIEVNDKMETNIKDVYAAGDVTNVTDLASGEKGHIPLAGPANRQGRTVADNICGLDSRYNGSLGTSIVKVFDIVAASSGMNSVRLSRGKKEYATICIHPSSHASYYPGSTQIHAKLFYDRTSRKIYGIQAVGKEGVDKLIDVVSTAMILNGSVDDLAKLEQAYAPPFLSAKSPANYLGFIAQNEKDGLEELVTVEEALEENDDHVLLDVRTDGEYGKGTLGKCVHIPVDELRDRLGELEPYREKTIDVYCAVGIRGHIASRILRAYGYKTRNVTGAYTTFKAMTKEDM